MTQKDIISLLSSLPLDLRAEVVITDILANGYDASDIFIRPVGLFQRRFQKDILNAEPIELTNYEEALVVNTTREGLYDSLPENMIHNSPGRGSKAFKSSTEMVDQYRKRIEEEKEARKFFMIYEIEFFRQRIANAWQERHLQESISYSMRDNEILAYWKLPEIFDYRQKGILFYLYPVFHKIRGSLNYMNQVYSLIIQHPVSITRGLSLPVLGYPDNHLRLGSMVLSRNSVVGNSIQYSFPSFIIEVEALAKKDFFNFLPTGKMEKVISKLNEYFVPGFCEAEIRVEKQIVPWKLLDADPNESLLGFSTQLNS